MLCPRAWNIDCAYTAYTLMSQHFEARCPWIGTMIEQLDFAVLKFEICPSGPGLSMFAVAWFKSPESSRRIMAYPKFTTLRPSSSAPQDVLSWLADLFRGQRSAGDCCCPGSGTDMQRHSR